MHPFLSQSRYIDWNEQGVLSVAATLAGHGLPELVVVKRCFEFVRDQIRHSADFKINPVTCRASDVLRYKTGFCYAKSHLLAALLRANGIPAGLCYQRLSVGDAGAPYCLHGLNAVFLQDYGWYRLDPRGNKPSVTAEFCPPREALAFAVREPAERDLPEILAEPLPVIVQVLEAHSDYEQVLAHLPDLQFVAQMATADATLPQGPEETWGPR